MLLQNDYFHSSERNEQKRTKSNNQIVSTYTPCMYINKRQEYIYYGWRLGARVFILDVLISDDK